MSTYLVAFANGRFDHIESSYVSPLSGKTRPLRIYGEISELNIWFIHRQSLSYVGVHQASGIRFGHQTPNPSLIRTDV